MTDKRSNEFAFFLNQQLIEKNIDDKVVSIYQHSPFGMVLTINQRIFIAEQDHFAFQEMMTHPALFTHTNAEHIAIVGDATQGILREVLKHERVRKVTVISENKAIEALILEHFSAIFTATNDSRIEFIEQNPLHYFTQEQHAAFDVIIEYASQDERIPMLDVQYQHALKPDGLFVYASAINFWHLDALQRIDSALKHAGFYDCQLLHFSQPSYPTGLRLVVIAKKTHAFRHLREKLIFNKNFMTRFYNLDIHKAALVLPTFCDSFSI